MVKTDKELGVQFAYDTHYFAEGAAPTGEIPAGHGPTAGHWGNMTISSRGLHGGLPVRTPDQHLKTYLRNSQTIRCRCTYSG